MAQQGILAVLLLLILGLPGIEPDSCGLKGDPQVDNLLIQMLGSIEPTGTPNPSILLALRLSSDHNLEVEHAMVQRIKEDAVYRVANNQDFTSGTVALYVMALQASCENPRVVSTIDSPIDLVQHLQQKYEQERKSIGTEMKGVTTGNFREHPQRGRKSTEEGEVRPAPGSRNLTNDFEVHTPKRPESEAEGDSRLPGGPSESNLTARNTTGDFGERPPKGVESEVEREPRPPQGGPGKGNRTGTDTWGNITADIGGPPPRGHDSGKKGERRPPRDQDGKHSEESEEEEEDHDENSRDNSDEDSEEEMHGRPLTNYYQIGLDIMALCLQNIPVDLTNVLEASCSERSDGSERRDGPKQSGGFGDKFSVDTGAVMVLGLICVANRQDLAPSDRMAVNSTLTCLVQKIIKSKQEDGVMGNIYSTGLAMQALSVAADYYGSSDWNCSQTLLAVSEAISKGKFNNPMAASQITPSLQGRTYLDIRGLTCSADQDNLPVVSTPPYPSVLNLSEIVVNYRVVDNVYHSFNNSLSLNVPSGASFLQVMEAAESVNPRQFSFSTEPTTSGPFVVSINGLPANSTARTYWQLQNGSTPLNQGVADYKPQDGEQLGAVFTTW